MAIQLILAKELGVLKRTPSKELCCGGVDGPCGGGCPQEFDQLTSVAACWGRGTQYQRSIGKESLYCEHLKHGGELPIVGINTFRTQRPLLRIGDLLRWIAWQTEEKDAQIESVRAFQARHAAESDEGLKRLEDVALSEQYFAS